MNARSKVRLGVWCVSLDPHFVHTADLIGDNHHGVHMFPHSLHQLCLLTQTTFKSGCVHERKRLFDYSLSVATRSGNQVTHLLLQQVLVQLSSVLHAEPLPPSPHCSAVQSTQHTTLTHPVRGSCIYVETSFLTWNISLERHTEKRPEHPELMYQSVRTVLIHHDVCVHEIFFRY